MTNNKELHKAVKKELNSISKKLISLDAKYLKTLEKANKAKEKGLDNSELKEKAKLINQEIKELKKEFNKKNKLLNVKKNKTKVALKVEGFNAFYKNKQALENINIEFPKNKIISIIGPSGCGKSTFLKSLNRINDEVATFRAEGRLILDEEIDVLTLKNLHSDDKIDLSELRTRIGMVFQQPNPFPMSIYKNVVYGPKISGVKNRAELNKICVDSLKKAALYDEVKDNLNAIGTSLSGGQQQRLCIARAVANRPDILLMDEPTSALDPIAAAKIEKLIMELKKDYTIIMVTHSMQQAARISDYTAFFYEGKLIEFGETKKIFQRPKQKKTSDYIRGKFG